MAQQVVNGGTCKCTMGSAPSTLVFMPSHKTLGCNQPAANIMDHVDMMNIMPFGPCKSMAFPATAAATAAALGVLTPMPCIPKTPSPWTPGAPTVLLDGNPALDNTSTLMCVYGGTISITAAGQGTVIIP